MKSLLAAISFVLFFSPLLIAQNEPCDAFQLECNSPPIIGTFDGYTSDLEYPFSCPFFK